ncbi:uncharacterized protein N7459_003431 [Penicillium hispanicum]|uniref:uncharacterized protein n=1 Tax=Penicillium hispanicum TaxID=1080232 RepID=UPI002540A3D9|nr:uncharacterized protein N7459_003431 [Penicillium hispanicum]KAJ5587666.1 hypothetical protein N7459_003431 [Penicillium hispanicum]
MAGGGEEGREIPRLLPVVIKREGKDHSSPYLLHLDFSGRATVGIESWQPGGSSRSTSADSRCPRFSPDGVMDVLEDGEGAQESRGAWRLDLQPARYLSPWANGFLICCIQVISRAATPSEPFAGSLAPGRSISLRPDAVVKIGIREKKTKPAPVRDNPASATVAITHTVGSREAELITPNGNIE